HHDVASPNCFVNRQRSEAIPDRAFFVRIVDIADDHTEIAVPQVQRLCASLVSVSDDGYGLAGEGCQIRVFFIENFHLSPALELAKSEIELQAKLHCARRLRSGDDSECSG